MEDPSDTHGAKTSGRIQINVERMMGGTGGSGGQATHGGVGGTGGHGQGARIIGMAQHVIIHNHSDANQILDTALESKLEKWLKAPDPNEKQSHFCGLVNRSPCSWLFEDTGFILWRNNPGELLWIEGASGTGKTIVSSMIIERLFKDRASLDDIAVAYFYFDFTDLSKQSVDNSLRRLVLQLSRQSPVPYETLAQHYDSCKGQTIPTYTELLVILEKLLRTLGRTYLILDALDECKTSDHDRIVDFIQKIRAWSDIQLHVLVTSQPREIFEKKLLSLRLSRIAIHADTTSDDIRLYTSNELASKSELQHWLTESEQIIDYITDKSAGMFRLAYCLLEQLKECVRLYDLQEALDSLPDNLHDIYARSLRSVPKKHFSDVERILHWLVFSERPLTLAQLEDTIAFDFSDSERYIFDPRRRPKRGVFMKWLSVLLSIEPSYYPGQNSVLDSDGFYRGNCTVSLAHSSVQDYLLLDQENHPSSCDVCPIHVTEEAAHRLMAHICVCYLLHFADHRLNPQTLPNYPLAIYAAKNWCYHLLCCADQAALSSLTMGLLEDGSHQYTALTALNNLDWSACSQPPKRWGYLTENPPLCLCAVHGYVEGVKFLLDRGADTEAKGEYAFGVFTPGTTALHCASANGHFEIVRLLLENGANVNAPGCHTALGLAVKHGYREIVHLLLENGADTNVIQDYGRGTVLQLASCRGDIEIIHFLLEKGVDVNTTSNRKYSTLQQASRDGYLAIVRLLLEKGADINIDGVYGSALHLASKNGHLEIVHLLLENGADVNRKGKQGTALQLAAMEGQTEIVRFLLEKGADCNAIDKEHYNALQLASWYGHLDCVRLLLENGADINEDDGGTPLQLASREGHIKIVELLLESGADVNAEGGEHGSAWRCASDSTHDEIADLLLKHGAIPSIRSQRASRRRATRAATQTKDEKHTKRMGNVDIMEIVDSDEEDLVTAHSKLSVEGVIDLTED